MLVQFKHKNEKSFTNITKDKVDHVVEIQENYIRIINDVLEPILIPSDFLLVVDGNIDGWVVDISDYGEIFLMPKIFSYNNFFFEDLFDNDKEAKTIWINYLSNLSIS